MWSLYLQINNFRNCHQGKTNSEWSLEFSKNHSTSESFSLKCASVSSYSILRSHYSFFIELKCITSYIKYFYSIKILQTALNSYVNMRPWISNNGHWIKTYFDRTSSCQSFDLTESKFSHVISVSLEILNFSLTFRACSKSITYGT